MAMIGRLAPRMNQTNGRRKTHIESIADTGGRPAGLGTLTQWPSVDDAWATVPGGR
jgi:hypothetical protein